eukprot:1967844-Amphidinium_carterae.2
MPTPPQEPRIQLALDRLEELGALVAVQHVSPLAAGSTRDGRELTQQLRPSAFGRLLQELPFDPNIGSLIMNGLRYGALEDCALLAAVHRGSPLDPFQDHPDFTQEHARKFVDVSRVLLSHVGDLQSDLVMGLQAYRAWQVKVAENGEDWAARHGPEWCEAHFLSFSRLLEVEEFYVQVRDALEKLDYSEGLDSESRQRLRKRRKAAARNPRRSWKDLSFDNPARDFQNLFELHDVDRNMDRDGVLAWCLCASFPHGLMEILEGKHSSTVAYLVEAEKALNLRSYLQALGFHPDMPRTALSRDDDMDECLVNFAREDEAWCALKTGNFEKERDCPYRKTDQPKNERTRMKVYPRKCFAAHECKLGSDSIVWPLRARKVTLITTEVLPVRTKDKSKLFFMLSKNTIVPDGMLVPVLLATYPMIKSQTQGFEVRFYGKWERFSITHFEQTLPDKARQIRQNLDEEFKPGMPDSRRRQIVQERRSIVCDIMRQLRNRKVLVSTREGAHENHGSFLQDVDFSAIFT